MSMRRRTLDAPASPAPTAAPDTTRLALISPPPVASGHGQALSAGQKGPCIAPHTQPAQSEPFQALASDPRASPHHPAARHGGLRQIARVDYSPKAEVKSKHSGKYDIQARGMAIQLYKRRKAAIGKACTVSSDTGQQVCRESQRC